MELDEAFKMAVRKFYEGSSHGTSEKYAKGGFRYNLQTLEAMKKKYVKKTEGEE